MELKKPWYYILIKMDEDACIDLENTPAATVYSAIRYNKTKFAELGMRFKIQTTRQGNSIKKAVCRIT